MESGAEGEFKIVREKNLCEVLATVGKGLGIHTQETVLAGEDLECFDG